VAAYAIKLTPDTEVAFMLIAMLLFRFTIGRCSAPMALRSLTP
jgi:hypothetical protein